MTDIDVSPKASLVTLGCPMNQVDSERIISGLASQGFEIVTEEEADVIVVNTCGFIESAREESIDTILSIAELKKRGNLKALVVAGCLAERYKAELQGDLPEADAIVGLCESGKIPELCRELIMVEKPEETFYSRAVLGHPHIAYLKIAEGCDNRCSYCAIPMIRGSYRDIPQKIIINEAKELAGLGIKELILIGQDTTRYGSDVEGLSLPGLLEKLNDIEGIEWIRLMYAHPAHFKEDLVEAFTGLPKILPYIDLPIQHISGRILKHMGRNTPPGLIRDLIERLREHIDGLVLRTALITGFPGETEHDFQELADFVEEYRFERLGAFVYSPEEGTRAALMDNHVPEDVAQERCKAIMEIQSKISSDFHKSLIGREFDMIVDEVDPDSREAFGRTYMDAPDIDGNVSVARGVKEGKAFCRIRVTDTNTYDLVGEVV